MTAPQPTPASVTPAPVGGRRVALAGFWRAYRRDREGLIGLAILVLFGLVAIFAPVLADPEGLRVTRATGPSQGPPSWAYPLGTDVDGRSVLTLVIHGTRVSLIVGLAAAAISILIGTFAGIAAGHFHGLIGGVVNRLTEWFLVIPFLPLAIVLATVFPPAVPKLLAVIIVIGRGAIALVRRVLIPSGNGWRATVEALSMAAIS